MSENNKKILIVYYSRSGVSEIIAKDLQNKLGCDMDKIVYADKDRVSFFRAAREATKKYTVKIKGAEHNPGDYEKIIFVTPIWAGAISTPIRSYMAEHKENIKSYTLITTSGSGDETPKIIKDAVDASRKESAVSKAYSSAQIKKGEYDLGKFIE